MRNDEGKPGMACHSAFGILPPHKPLAPWERAVILRALFQTTPSPFYHHVPTSQPQDFRLRRHQAQCFEARRAHQAAQIPWTLEGRPSPDEPAEDPSPNKAFLVRLNRYLSQCGVASRRGAEDRSSSEGRVSINGHIIKELATQVSSGRTRSWWMDPPSAPRRRSSSP
jgi:hypothetical protein